jgi:hypothetical protein
MKPKQIIATNGNPQTAVSSMTPDTISTGTVPLLEMLQMHKEQATGLSKAAQGLNDTLYVSGNSEEKMQRAMTAAQVRIQYMARRFVETGIKRLVEGVYKTIREKMRGHTVNYFDQNEVYQAVDPSTLPSNMLLQIDADVGENSNSNIVKKMTMIGQQLLPALQAAGAGGVISPDAAVKIAAKTIEAMDLDPLDYLEDYTSDEFKKKAQASKDNEMKAAEKLRELEEQIKQLNIAQQQATIDLTNVQSKNSMQDNIKQLMVALDKSNQEWAKLYIDAAKEGVQLPPKPDINDLLGIATKAIQLDIANDASRPANGVELAPQQGPSAAMPDQMM